MHDHGLFILAAIASAFGSMLDSSIEKKEIVEILNQILQDRGLNLNFLHEIQDLNGEIADHKGEITDLKREITDLKEETRDLKREITDLTGEITDLKGDNTGLKAENAVMKKEITHLKGTVTNVETEIKDLKHKLEAIKIKNQQQITGLKLEINNSKATGLDLKSNRASSKNEERMEITHQDESDKGLKADNQDEKNPLQSNKGPANILDNKINSKYKYPKTLRVIMKQELMKSLKNSEGKKGHGIERVKKREKFQCQDELMQSEVNRLKRHANTSHVAFSAYLGHDVFHLAPGNTIKCEQIILNDGNGYNTNTGVFTARVTGVYLFHFSIAVSGQDQWAVVKLVIDNRNTADVIVGSENGEEMVGSTIIVQVNENESVWLEAYINPDGETLSSPTIRGNGLMDQKSS